MFEVFDSTLTLTHGLPGVAGADVDAPSDLVIRFGGCTFNDGLYRVHTRESSAAADVFVRQAFPEFGDRISCFGFDWLGRQFSTDSSRGETSDPEVLLFEPGTGQALEIPVPFSKFHDEELVEYTDAVLASGFFTDWIATQHAPLRFEDCVGYRQPLFLNGSDSLSNLEVSSMDVYWTIMGQLRIKALKLPIGTRITEVHTE